MRQLVMLILFLAILCLGQRVQAALTIPVGVQNDVSINTVVNTWGWTVAYQGDYKDRVTIADMFANATGDYVMLATFRDGSPFFDILAAALKTDVLTYTAMNTTHAANGAAWYFNGLSMGFAGLGDTIRQGSADTFGAQGYGLEPQEDDHMSWHTSTTFPNWSQSTTLPAVAVMEGWRSGLTSDKNVHDGTWNRMILTASSLDAAVPEPASVVVWSLLGLALGGVGWRRRRKLAA